MRDEKYDEAEPLLQKAFQLSERVLGTNHPVTAVNARNLGSLYAKRRKFDAAKSYWKKALEIDAAVFGDKSKPVAGDLLALANLSAQAGDPKQAQDCIRRAAEIEKVAINQEVTDDGAVVGTAGGTNTPVADKWALVIGISSFRDPSINLKYAAKDATDFKTFLVNSEHFRDDHVKLLTDESATRENILGMIGEKWLQSHAKPDDLVVIFISSHGSAPVRDAGDTNYLVAYDTDKRSIPETGIAMQRLASIVAEKVPCKRVVFLLDVCHSGSADGSKDLVRKNGVDPVRVNFGTGKLIVCSSLADQVSWESCNYENSVFTRRLIESLNDNKNKASIIRAFPQLKIMVESEVLRDRGELQIPMMVTKHWLGGDVDLAGH